MLFNRIIKFPLALLAVVAISSCAQNQSESELAASMDLNVSSTVVVSPADRSEDSSCVEGGVSGPQVRIWVSLSWPGVVNGSATEDKLIPLAIYLKIDNTTQLTTTYNKALGTIGDGESISALFGVTDDYIAPSTEVHSSDICFADFGGLPTLKTPLIGNQQISVTGTIQLMGVLRRGNSIEVPFVKEAKTKIVYVVGSTGT